MSNSSGSISQFGVYLILVFSFGVSLILGEFGGSVTAVTAIFAIAAFKAFLVVSRFMHLSSEPAFLRIGVMTLLGILCCLFVGLVPDIVFVGQRVAP